MKRDGVFISYSKKDVKWLNDLRVHLRYLEREYQFTIWEDSKIETGADWRVEINKAINTTKVAILLVSANFISSDFIANEELPALLSAARDEGAHIFPIIVSHCMFHDIEAISKFQAINSPSEPLIIMNEGQRDALYVKVTQEIKRVLSSSTILPSRHGHTISLDELRTSFHRVMIMNIFFENHHDNGLSIKKIFTLSKAKKRKDVIRVIHELESLELISKTKRENLSYYTLTANGYHFVEHLAKS
ncbi:toll/interleukin-1 receptor domain-containing protein [Aquimarina sp. U1-2]|uniref:toll/interleukin-1 receptor domain-containing protein n=1 Tax=Aquimarina sp. U1-2 TaxID=2823141 RepID=UPI001AECDD89|nr:toll/interleukin-1 receptor domain-containing protein [Aquimarina sp. U1-2]MBP2831935.1 toll/interleukin-1 receptor domain-containing protein [Aquimarina sp. U1-2]